MDSSPSLLSTFLPTAWLGSHHRARLIESYAFHLQCMFFVLCQLQKTHFSFFSTSRFPCLLLASLCGVRGGRECGFNQRAGQPPPLMIRSTSRLTEERGRGGWVKHSAWWFQLRFPAKSHVNMTADSAGCPRRQIHPAATCKDGLPQHALHREGERERDGER